jgi:hypothetical protein
MNRPGGHRDHAFQAGWNLALAKITVLTPGRSPSDHGPIPFQGQTVDVAGGNPNDTTPFKAIRDCGLAEAVIAPSYDFAVSLQGKAVGVAGRNLHNCPGPGA